MVLYLTFWVPPANYSRTPGLRTADLKAISNFCPSRHINQKCVRPFDSVFYKKSLKCESYVHNWNAKFYKNIVKIFNLYYGGMGWITKWDLEMFSACEIPATCFSLKSFFIHCKFELTKYSSMHLIKNKNKIFFFYTILHR